MLSRTVCHPSRRTFSRVSLSNHSRPFVEYRHFSLHVLDNIEGWNVDSTQRRLELRSHDNTKPSPLLDQPSGPSSQNSILNIAASSSYAVGDIVEFTQDGGRSLQLGIVKTAGCNAFYVVTDAPMEKLVFKHQVRFYFPKFIDHILENVDVETGNENSSFPFYSEASSPHKGDAARLEKAKLAKIIRLFEQRSRIALSNCYASSQFKLIELCENVMKKYAGRPDIVNRVFSISDLAKEIFEPMMLEKGIKPEIMHALHRFLYFNTTFLIKPPNIGQNGPYILRPYEQHKLLERLNVLFSDVSRRVLALKNFRANLQGIVDSLYSSVQSSTSHSSRFIKDIQKDEDQSILLSSMKHFAMTHAYNEPNNPFQVYVEAIKSGILDMLRTPGELLTWMIKARLIEGEKEPNIHVYQSSLDINHSEDYMALARNFRDSLVQMKDSQSSRYDFGDLLAIAIDSRSTTEVDDALSVLPDGRIVIHIADPSSIIPLNSPLDLLCRQKISTIYTPESKHLMIPCELSDELSLDAHHLCKYALSFICKLDEATGRLVDFDIKQSIIHNLVRIDYDEADIVMEKGENNDSLLTVSSRINDDTKMAAMRSALLRLFDIAKLRKAYRVKELGAIGMDFPFPEVELNEEKTLVKSITNSLDNGTFSQLLVSEAMILCGEVTANFGAAENLALPYRIHRAPFVDSSDVQEALNKIRNGALLLKPGESALHPQFLLTSYRLAPLMTRSCYSTIPGKHWALGLPAYCRSSSPMRRYMDLLAHYLVKEKLFGLESRQALNPADIEAAIIQSNLIEPRIKHCQTRSIKFWILKKIAKDLENNPNESFFSGIIVDRYLESLNYHVFVKELFLSFKIQSGSSYELGDSVVLRPVHVIPYSNIIRWEICPSNLPNR